METDSPLGNMVIDLHTPQGALAELQRTDP